MGIKFGEIDSSQILQNEYKIGVSEGILRWIMDNNNSLISPSKEDIEEIRKNYSRGVEGKISKIWDKT
ncbi:hypothetical protein ES705_35874 [subsurface metagenome]